MSNNIVIAALYKFVKLPNYKKLQSLIIENCKLNNIKGTLLLAEEGINGTISGSREDLDNILTYLKSISAFANLLCKESYHHKQPFLRMKVKLKKEIVTLGVPGVSPTEKVGIYVKPKDWNQLISDPNTVLIDTRNYYETDIGKFKGAICPQTTNFCEFPKFMEDNFKKEDLKHKKVAMYCTGGIRCEKSTSHYIMAQGFENVYHLEGGILKYLEEIPQENSLWEGECFVFDDRVAVNHNLKKGSFDQCHGCRHPITVSDMQSNKYKPGIHCPNCYDSLTDYKYERSSQRQKQIELSKARGEQHLG